MYHKQHRQGFELGSQIPVPTVINTSLRTPPKTHSHTHAHTHTHVYIYIQKIDISCRKFIFHRFLEQSTPFRNHSKSLKWHVLTKTFLLKLDTSCKYVVVYIYHHYHHQITLLAWYFQIISFHSFLPSITSMRSSKLHPVPIQSICK